jgi:hypothetical protein
MRGTVIRLMPLGWFSDTAFSGESSESEVWFWQCIADGFGDRNVRRSRLRWRQPDGVSG